LSVTTTGSFSKGDPVVQDRKAEFGR